MSKKKNKKLINKLNKLNKKLYDNNKYVSSQEFLVSKLSKSLKRYYDSLSAEKKNKFIEYIIKDGEWQERRSLERLNTSETDESILCEKECKSISEIIKEIDRVRKRRKKLKKNKNVLQTKNGLMYILNPEAYDQTLLSDKKYRKYLRKMVEKEKNSSPVEIDCTLKNFKKQLMKNDSVNSAVVESFWNKHGF